MEKYIYGILVVSGVINLCFTVVLVMFWRHVKTLKKQLFSALEGHIETLKEYDSMMKKN